MSRLNPTMDLMILKKLSSTESFISKANKIHNYKYDYIKVNLKVVNITNLPFDFYLPDFNMCIEYN